MSHKIILLRNDRDTIFHFIVSNERLLEIRIGRANKHLDKIEDLIFVQEKKLNASCEYTRGSGGKLTDNKCVFPQISSRYHFFADSLLPFDVGT